ncbi:uncharacterized protein LOC134827879 [Culicoides brevitarsis]|uniref:uncharacterized protein LOC134827879 n=1 Tax=Culicoides brevitarsis TaxID=469753 RepID=UPI00307B85E2
MELSRTNTCKFLFAQTKNFEEQLRNMCSLNELFAEDIQLKRKSLIELCQKLMFCFSDDFELKKKARDIIWRKGYYDIICLTKRFIANKKTNDDEILTFVETLIFEGISLFKKMISNFETGLKDIIDEKLIDDLQLKNSNLSNERTEFGETIDIKEKIIYANLISIGDLHRYLKDLHLAPDIATDDKIAVYYLQAFKFNPFNGMAHNQLGTLYRGKNHEIDSLYHYIYALSCKDPFYLSEKNLNNIFYLNSKYLELNIDSNIKYIYARFILLIDILFYDKVVDNFTHLCHSFLIDMKKKLNDIDSEILFKMTSIFFLCLYKLMKISSKKVHSINALLVAFTSDLLDHCNSSVDTYVSENQKRNNLFYLSYNNVYDAMKEKIDSRDEECEVTKEKKIFKTISRRRPVMKNELYIDHSDIEEHHKCYNNSSTDECSSFGSYDSHDSMKSFGDTDIIILKEELIYPINDGSHSVEISKNKKETESCQNSLQLPKRRNSHYKVDPNLIIEYSAKEKSLKPLKIIFDWMILNPDILTNCHQTNPELIYKIMRLVNFLNIDIFSDEVFFDRSFICHPDLRFELQNLFDIRKQFPLDEDQQFKRFGLFEKLQNSIDWKLPLKLQLTYNEMVLLRIVKIVDFGFHLCDNTAFNYFFCSKKRIFTQMIVKNKIYKKTRKETNKRNETASHSKPLKDIKDKKTKNEKLATLWLNNEVCSLEDKIKMEKNSDHTLTPYVVIDTKAITMFTSIVKYLLKTKQFVILVPLIVISELDGLKKRNEKVRNIIKWIEQQFLKGSRFLRPQKQNECLELDKIKKNMINDSETFYHIVSFCNYVVANNTKEDPYIITFLTGEEINSEFQRMLGEIPVLHEQINNFYLKLKNK